MTVFFFLSPHLLSNQVSNTVIVILFVFPDYDVYIKAPKEVKVKATSPSEIKVKWSEYHPTEEDDLNSLKKLLYLVQYWSLENNDKQRHRISTENPKATLSELEPGQKYAVRVKTVLPGGKQSAWTKVKVVQTPFQGTYFLLQ